jgi:release factor glutamine methyltransferase
VNTVDALLAHGRRRGVDRLDARLLVAHALHQPAAWPLAHGDDPVDPPDAERIAALLERRAAGEPLAYLTGAREFRGLSLQVDRRVLVPRPETEALVDWALEILDARAAGPTARVVDLGTGSGAIGLAIAHARRTVEVTATDASAEALDCARDNADRLGVALRLRRGDWWAATPGERFDLAVSNPPYIAEHDPHLAALTHEPPTALASGPLGLDALRRIAAEAPRHLPPGGWLLLEHGHDQADAVRRALAAAGFEAVETRPDLAGHARLSGGRRCP